MVPKARENEVVFANAVCFKPLFLKSPPKWNKNNHNYFPYTLTEVASAQLFPFDRATFFGTVLVHENE